MYSLLLQSLVKAAWLEDTGMEGIVPVDMQMMNTAIVGGGTGIVRITIHRNSAYDRYNDPKSPNWIADLNVEEIHSGIVANSQSVSFGTAPTGTVGIDDDLGEVELPPPPPEVQIVI